MPKIITNNFNEQLSSLSRLLGKDAPKIIFKAEAIALKRAVISARTQITKTARQKLNILDKPAGRKLKAKQFKEEFIRTKTKIPKRGPGFARVTVLGKPVQLSRFLMSPKTPPDQKGIKAGRGKKKRYPGRKRVKVQVFKGRKTTLNSAFVFYDKRGTLQVGQRRSPPKRKRRSDGQPTDVHAQTLTGASIATFFYSLRVRDALQKKMSVVFETNFRNRFGFFARKELQRRVKVGLRRQFK